MIKVIVGIKHAESELPNSPLFLRIWKFEDVSNLWLFAICGYLRFVANKRPANFGKPESGCQKPESGFPKIAGRLLATTISRNIFII